MNENFSIELEFCLTYIQKATGFDTFLDILRAQHPLAAGDAAASFFTTIRPITQQMCTHFIVVLEILTDATIQLTNLFFDSNFGCIVRQRHTEIWCAAETHRIVYATLI